MNTTFTSAPGARRIHHPGQRDSATFLVTAEESAGRRSLLEIELFPGGGNQLHYHAAFAEHFEVLEGELVVQLGRETTTLRPGERIVDPPGVLHRFANPSAATTRFRVELRPGHAGFEHALRIAYGLAADGLADRKGLPRSLAHTALLVEMSDTRFPGLLSFSGALTRFLARRARERGVERELLARYCPPFAPLHPD